jgi:transcription elongation factor Elf1
MEPIATQGQNPGDQEIKKPEPKYFPCFLCGDLLEIKMTIREKPYFICDSCGLQAFIRREKGIERLEFLISENSFDAPEIKNTPNKILNWVNQLEKLQAKLTEIGDKEWIFADEKQEELKKIIRGEIRKIEKNLRKK